MASGTFLRNRPDIADIPMVAYKKFPSREDRMDTPEDYTTALAKAIATWRKGRRISMTLAAALMEEGYDVPALENHYTNN